jgi:hypothetical protein
VRAGYPVKSKILWKGVTPRAGDWRKIGAACVKLEREMHEWKPGGDAKRAPISASSG